MNSARHRLTCCPHVSLLVFYVSLLLLPAQGSIFSKIQPKSTNNIVVDGPSTIVTNRGDDLNVLVTGSPTSSPLHLASVPMPGSKFIQDDDKSITAFLRRTSSKLFGRKQSDTSSKNALDIDPSNLSLPELFTALAKLPSSKFDKIADQLIAETFGMGTVVPAPPGFLSGLGFPALPVRTPVQTPRTEPQQDMRHAAASNKIASIVPGLGLIHQHLQAAASNMPPPIILPNGLAVPNVVFPVFVPKDQPLPGERGRSESHSNSSGHFNHGVSTHGPMDVTQAASQPFFSFPSSAEHHLPSHHLMRHMDQQQHQHQQQHDQMQVHNAAMEQMPQSQAHHNQEMQQQQHPLESLNRIVHSGFLPDINKLSQSSFPMDGNPNPSTTRNHDQHVAQQSQQDMDNGDRGRQQDRWFAEQSFPHATQVRSDGRPLVMPFPHHSLAAHSPDFGSGVLEGLLRGNARRVSGAGRAYPILDTSSSTPRVYHAPHNPVDILRIFATAYHASRAHSSPASQSASPSSSQSLFPSSASSSPTSPSSALASSSTSSSSLQDQMQRAASEKDGRSTGPATLTTVAASFPVFMKDDSVTTASALVTDPSSSLRPREIITYLS